MHGVANIAASVQSSVTVCYPSDKRVIRPRRNPLVSGSGPNAVAVSVNADDCSRNAMFNHSVSIPIGPE